MHFPAPIEMNSHTGYHPFQMSFIEGLSYVKKNKFNSL